MVNCKAEEFPFIQRHKKALSVVEANVVQVCQCFSSAIPNSFPFLKKMTQFSISLIPFISIKLLFLNFAYFFLCFFEIKFRGIETDMNTQQLLLTIEVPLFLTNS